MPRPVKYKDCTDCALQRQLRREGKVSHSWCPRHVAEYNKLWWKRNSGYKTKWRREHPEKEYAYNRRGQLKREYGMSPEEYDIMFKRQGGLCAICGCSPKDTLQVDHNHKTGMIRGLLCKACNRGLGMLKDDVDILRAAVRYLS